MHAEAAAWDVAAPFFETAAAGKLMLQRCDACSAIVYYPRLRCPACLSANLSWVDVSGEGTLYAYTTLKGIDDALVGIIELAEGVRVTGRVLPGDKGKVAVGDPVRWIAAAAASEDSCQVLTFAPVGGSQR